MDTSEPKIFMRNKKAFACELFFRPGPSNAFDSPSLLNEQAIEIALTRPTD